MRKGDWDSSNTDLSRYKLSDMELLQKHAAVVSKNKEVARMEWAQKQALLKQGIVPKEMQAVMKKAKPVPVKRDCKSTLKRPSSTRPSVRANTVAMTKTQQSRYSGLRTTTGVDPQAATLKPEVPVSAPKDDPFESLKRLDEAMNQLERAMVSAIEDSPSTDEYTMPQKETALRPTKVESYSYEKPISYSPGRMQGSSPRSLQRYTEDAAEQRNEQAEEEVSESSVFSLSPDRSQEAFYPMKCREEGEDVICLPPSWQEYENVRPSTAIPQSASFIEPKTSEAISVQDPLEEPNICSVETADYFAKLLEQTRKDLEQMQIPEQSFVEEEEGREELPQAQSFGRNYEADLIPKPYVLKPVARELYNPVVRTSGLSANSLCLGSSLGPPPQKYSGPR